MIRLLPRREISAPVWRLAGPVVVGMISQTLLGVVDTAMVGRLGAVSLAAAGLGGVLSWMILGAVGNLHVGTQAVSARRFGERRHEEAGKTLDNSLLIALIVGTVTSSLIAWGVREAFGLFVTDPAVEIQGRDYVMYRLLGALPFMVIMAHRGFFNGIGETHLHMKVAITVNVVNVIFNYFLIFGTFGFPMMGTAGAGLASTIGTTAGMLLFVAIGIYRKERRGYGYYRLSNLDSGMILRVVRLAAPAALRGFLVMAGFSAFSAIVARIGTVQMAATNVILTIISMSFLPGAGFGLAAASLIGQKLGEGKPDRAEEYGYEAARLGILTMGAMGLLFILIPGLLFSLFTNDTEVIRTGIAPLRLMGFVQIFDAAGMVFSGALDGAGMTKWVLFAELSVSWGFFIPATLLFSHVFGWGLVGAWSALGLYLVLFGVLVINKYARGAWKSVEV